MTLLASNIRGIQMDSASAMKSVEANIHRGRAAMVHVLLEKADVKRAMFRTGMGWVDFVWGDMRKGVAHVLVRRQSEGVDAPKMLAQDMVNAIAQGVEIRRAEFGKSTRVVLRLKGHEAVLIRNKGSNSWLLTGFEDKPDGEGRGATPSSPTQAAPIRSRQGLGAGKPNPTTSNLLRNYMNQEGNNGR